MNEFIFYLSPIVGLFVFGLLIVFIKARAGKVKVAGFDYFWWNRFERKIQSRLKWFQVGAGSFISAELFYNMAEKFIRKVKIEALRTQVWADKILEKLRENRNEQMLP